MSSLRKTSRLLIGLVIASLCVFELNPARAQSQSEATLTFQAKLDSVLQKRRAEARQNAQERQQREQDFLKKRDERLELVKQLRKKHAVLTTERTSLENELRDLQVSLEKQREQYNLLIQELGDFPQVITAFSTKLKEFRNESFFEVFPTATGELLRQAESTKASDLPEYLQNLWPALLEDIDLAGKISEVRKPTVAPDGSVTDHVLLFYGPFQVVTADGVVVAGPDPVVDGAVRLTTKSVTLPSSGDLLIDRTLGRVATKGPEDFGLFNYLKKGGTIGAIILFLGLVGLVIGSCAFVRLRKTDAELRRQEKAFPSIISDNPLSRIVRAVSESGGLDSEGVIHSVEAVLTKEVPALERGQRSLKLIAATAPLLGLLGTVSGMIITFQSISSQGTDPALMASGIAQALVTTMLGLIVAIPVLFVHAMLSATSDSLVSLLEERSLGLLAQFQQSEQREDRWQSSLPRASNS